VDVAQGREGSIYISDDLGGVVFKVTAGSVSPSASAGSAVPAPAGGAPVLALDEAAASRGRAVWVENQCDMCHDPALVGKDPDMPIKVLQKLGARYDVARMITYLKAPQPPMPLFELTDEQRRDLSAYVLTRFP